MGANGYIPPTSDAARAQRGDPDHVAPGTQEHLLGAGDPADLMFNAFGHASALMQELVGGMYPLAPMPRLSRDRARLGLVSQAV